MAGERSTNLPYSKCRAMTLRFFLSITCLLTTAAGLNAEPQVMPLLQANVEDVVDSEGLLVKVTYPPGSESAPHRHNAHTFVYVLEGSVVMQVEGGEPQTLGPGDVFYENPDNIHIVSRNVSATESATVLVFLVKTQDAPPSVPVAEE